MRYSNMYHRLLQGNRTSITLLIYNIQQNARLIPICKCIKFSYNTSGTAPDISKAIHGYIEFPLFRKLVKICWYIFGFFFYFHRMDDSHRPVKLRKVVLGFQCSENQSEFKFDLSLNYKLSGVIQTYSDQKPTLVVRI